MRRLLPAMLAASAAAADPAMLNIALDGGEGPGVAVSTRWDAPPELVLSGPPGEVRLKVDIAGFEGGEEAFARPVVIPTEGVLRIPLAAAAGAGFHRVRWTATPAAGKPVTGHAGLVRGPEPKRLDDGFWLGVAAHPQKTERAYAQREMALAARAGAEVLRTDALWSRIEPKPGERNWAGIDAVVDDASANGMQVQFILSYGTPHTAQPSAAVAAESERMRASGRGDAAGWMLMRAAQEDTAWRAFVRDLVQRCRGRVRLWEAWNEPDLTSFFLGSTDEYLRMLRSAAQEIRAADSQGLLLTGGFAGVGVGDAARFNQDVQPRVLDEASDSFDIHAYHGHGTFESFRSAVDGPLTRMRAKMDQPRPLYCNETAISSTHYGERLQAVTLVKKTAFSMGYGAVGYTWYDLRNDGRDPNEHEHNYGLLDRDFQPKPVFAAFRVLAGAIAGLRCTGPVDLGPGRLAYGYAGGDRRMVIAWNEDTTASEVPVAVRAAGATAATAIDLMGVERALPVADGVATVALGLDPVYLVFAGGGDAPEALGPVITVGDVLAVPGSAVAAPVVLRNPLARPLELTLAWPGMAGEQTMAVTVPASGQLPVELPALCPPTAAPGAPARLAVRYHAPAVGWEGTAGLYLHAVHPLPGGEPAGRPADFTIAAKTDVVSFFDGDPANQHLLWTGPDDHSARIWLASTGAALRMVVEVVDDRHVPGPDAASAWRGDGIQFAVQGLRDRVHWEFGVAQAADGAILRSMWIAPDATAVTPAVLDAACAVVDGRRRYDISLPLAAIGWTAADLAQGFRWSLVVNDNDGEHREGFIRVSPGIGERKDPAAFPILRLGAP